MHRTLSLTVPPAATANLARELATLDEVVGLSVTAGAALKPPGDVLTVHVLNRGMDKVLRCVAANQDNATISASTAELASIIDAEHAEAVANDVDEAILLSADNQTDTLRRGMAAGADDFLLKPFRPHEVLACLDKRLRVGRL